PAMVPHALNLADATLPRELPVPDPVDDSLEQRVRRLEDAVANLQDTRPIEDRIVERVSERLGSKPTPPPPERTEYMISAERRTPPPPEDRRAPLEPLPAAPMPVLLPPASPVPLPAAPDVERYPWLLFDFFRELRAIIRMFFDVRYPVGWSARVT